MAPVSEGLGQQVLGFVLVTALIIGPGMLADTLKLELDVVIPVGVVRAVQVAGGVLSLGLGIVLLRTRWRYLGRGMLVALVVIGVFLVALMLFFAVVVASLR